MTGYIIFHPKYPGWEWTRLTPEGQADNPKFQPVIDLMKQGIYTQKGYDLRCVPDTTNGNGLLTARTKDCVSLGHLFAPKKDRGSNVGLRPIIEPDRFRGRNWEADRARIERLLRKGYSISRIARLLGVSPSTLSKANRRYHFYEKRGFPCK